MKKSMFTEKQVPFFTSNLLIVGIGLKTGLLLESEWTWTSMQVGTGRACGEYVRCGRHS